jgi:hypothetical protein
MRRLLLATAASFAMIGLASAAPIAFTSSGAFSNVLGCDGSHPCQITNGGTVLSMSGSSASTLTADSYSYTGNTPATGVELGQLTWSDNDPRSPDTSFSVTYTLNVTFTKPNGDTDTIPFQLTVNQPNGLDPTISGFSITGLPADFNDDLAGVALTNFRFVATGQGSFSGNTWTFDADCLTSDLYLEADIKAVPEPMTMTLLGTGLIGLGLVARRHSR